MDQQPPPLTDLPERPCDMLGREVDHQPHEFDHPDGHATCPGWPMTPQPLTDRIAEALAAHRNGTASDGRGWFRTTQERAELYDVAAAVMAVVEPELAARDAQIARLTAELAAADDATNEAMLHNDATCGAVAERDRLRREVGLYVETLHRRDATIAQFRAALATDHHIAYHQGEPSDGLLHHCGRDHCPAPAVRTDEETP